MNSKHMMTMACAAAVCGSVSAFAETMEDERAELNWKMGEGVTFDETPIVSTEVGLAFDSKFLSYGLMDNKDPILTPSAAMTFFDALSVSVGAIYDITHYGRKAGYGNRAWRYQELDPGASLVQEFSPDDFAWLPTTIAFELGYMYEHHPDVVDDDTQFVNFSIGLPDLWFEPTFAYERDIDRDDGTYLNFEVGHTFTLVESNEAGGDDVLDFRLSAAQGWGDARRIKAYLEPNRPGMMDFCLKGELTWNVTDGVSVGGYVAYTDYLFDRALRHRARAYEATGHWKDSWNFTTGLSLAVSF